MIRTLLLAALCVSASCSTPTLDVDWRTLPSTLDAPGGEAWFARHPNGRLVVFGRHDANWGNHRLFVTRYVDGAWTQAEPAPFAADLDGRSVHFAPDGASLLFISGRLAPGLRGEVGNANVWRVTWDGETWGEPQPLPAPINTPGNEIDAVEVRGGVIYYTSMPPDEDGPKPDIYRAVPTGSGYRIEPVARFNTDLVESTLYVMPDESALVFSRTDDPGGVGRDDLFYARREGAGWGAPIHLGPAVNSETYEYAPELSPDGRTLYLTTHRGGQAHIIAVALEEALRR